MNECLICERVALAKKGRNPHLIAEMDHSYFVVGDHQFHQGYALVLLKEHVRDDLHQWAVLRTSAVPDTRPDYFVDF